MKSKLINCCTNKIVKAFDQGRVKMPEGAKLIFETKDRGVSCRLENGEKTVSALQGVVFLASVLITFTRLIQVWGDEIGVGGDKYLELVASIAQELESKVEEMTVEKR